MRDSKQREQTKSSSGGETKIPASKLKEESTATATASATSTPAKSGTPKMRESWKLKDSEI